MGSFSARATGQLLYGDGSGKTLYDNPIALSIAARNYIGYVRTVGIGQIAGLIDDVAPAGDVVRRIVEEAESLLTARLPALVESGVRA